MSDGDRSTRTQWGWVVLMVLGEVLMALAARTLDSAGGWAWFCLGAALVAAGGLQLRLLDVLRRRLPHKSAKQWVRFGAWITGAAVLAVAVWFAAPTAVAYGQFHLNGCAHPTELRVVVAPDDVELYRGVAEDYERASADAFGCPSTSVFVYPADPASALEGIGTGWNGKHARDVGPRPDVLIATSPGELDQLPGSYPKLGKAAVVAWTPMVLGVPTAEVRGLAELDRTFPTWHDLLRAVKAADLGLARPYPAESSVGLLATDALLSTADHRRLAGLPEAREVTRWAGRSSEAAGYPYTTAAGLLDTHRGAPGRTALIVTEHALVRSNLLARTDGRVALPDCGQDDAPAACVTAYYPSDTFRVQHTAVPVTWSPDSPQDDAAGDFTEWLVGETGRTSLAQAGLRTDGPPAGDLLTDRNGALAGPQVGGLRPEPDPARLADVRALHGAAERGSRVLFAIDASGSMTSAVAPGLTRLDTALRGVNGAAKLLSPNDEFGVSTFSGPGVRTIVQFGRRDAATAVAEQRLPGLVATGATPLHRAVVDGVAALGPSNDRTTSALVVLTDGENTVGGISADAMVDAVRDKGVRVFVVALGETDCAASALRALTEATTGACRDARPDSVDRVLNDLFQQLWG